VDAVGELATAAVPSTRRTRRSLSWALFATLATGLWPSVGAAREEPLAAPNPVDIHGFVSQGFIWTAENEYLAKAKNGSPEFSEAAINFTHTPIQNLRLGFQLFVHELGPIGNYRPQLDWYYLDYRVADWFGVRFGRTKLPFGLYNEINDIDVARVPILLPQSIYPIDHREFLYAQTGGEVYGDVRLGAAGALEYRAYGGTLSPDLPNAPPPGLSITDVGIPYLYGARLFWLTPLDGLLAGFSAQATRFDGDYAFDPTLQALLEAEAIIPASLTYPTRVKFRVARWVASLQYAAHDWDLSAEYSRWTGDFYSPFPLLLPPHTVNERYFAMASYRVTDWFTPGAYYSVYFANVKDRDAPGEYQRDLALTTRFDLNAHWLFKVEGHLMNGTGALDNRDLNEGADRDTLEQTWGMLLLKTTAYF
jgi:hypothetical protein